MTTAAFAGEWSGVFNRSLPEEAQNVDLFCGVGGWGEGAKAAGIPIHHAINHDDTAIEFHRLNNPECTHWKGDAWRVRPQAVLQGRPCGVLFASAACTTHSPARGGQLQISPRVHMLGWCIARWAREAKPEVIAIENVPEWQHWGPLVQKRSGNGRFTWQRTHPASAKRGGGTKKARKDKVTGPKAGTPEAEAFIAEQEARGCTVEPFREVCARRRGAHYRNLMRYFESLGYRGEVRIRDAKRSGAGSTRKRLYQCWVRDGGEISWPEPTHGPGTANAYVPAHESIDWSELGWSLFDRKQRQPKRKGHKRRKAGRPAAPKDDRPFELKPTTLARCAKGIGKYVLRTVGKKAHANPEPFILRLSQTGSNGSCSYPMSEPAPTQTTAHDLAAAFPLLAATGNGERAGQEARICSAREPHRTATASGSQGAALAPVAVRLNHGEKQESPMTDSLGCCTCGNRHVAVSAALVNSAHGGDHFRGGGVHEPFPTTDTSNGPGALAAVMIKNNGDGSETGYRGVHPDVPIGSPTAHNTQAVGVPVMVPCGGPRREPSHVGDPMHTCLTREDRGAVIPICTHARSGGNVQDPQMPLWGPSAGGNHAEAVAPVVTQYYSTGGMDQPASASLNAVVCKARHAVASAALSRLLSDREAMIARARQVAAFLVAELGAGCVPLNAEGLVVVVVDGVEMIMVDILYRMLQPRELARAMGFREDLVLPKTKEAAVKLIGNAVSPVESEALCRAWFPGGVRARRAAA